MTRGPNFVEKTGYAFGNFGKSVVWSVFEFTFLFILTDLWGVPPTQAGLLMFIALAWDGLLDPLIGVLVDRTRTPWGRCGPYLLLGAPLCAGAFAGMFKISNGDGNIAFLSALVAVLAFRTCYTVCDVPHNALLSTLSRTDRDATLIASLRYIFSAAGAILVAASSRWVLALETKPLRLDAIHQLALVAGIVYVVALWTAWLASKRADTFRPAAHRLCGLGGEMALLLGNTRLLALLALTFVQTATIPIFVKGLPYFGAHVAGTSGWVSAALIVFSISQALSIPLWLALAYRYSRRLCLLLTYGLICVSILAFAVFAPASPAVRLPLVAIAGLGIGGASMFIWALLPNAISYGEQKLGRRIEALPTGLFLLVIKVSLGVGAGAMGLGLAAVGYNSTAPSNAHLGGAIVTIMCAIPVFGAVICSGIAAKFLRSWDS